MSFFGDNTLLAANNTGFFILNEDEWVKAAHYNPVAQTYSFYATQSNNLPTAVTGDGAGNGGAGPTGNFANFNSVAGGPTTVGTNGGPSYFGIFDASGNVNEWTETSISGNNIRRGGNYATTSAINIGSRPATVPNSKDAFTGFRIGSYSNVGSNFAFVYTKENKDELNPAYSSGSLSVGAVAYRFYAGKYEVTNKEYSDFLNAVASGPNTDTYALFSSNMQISAAGGIVRYGSVNSYYYGPKANFDNRPVNFVSWFNAARYCNWLTNGKPTGPQNLQTTEDGMYYLNGIVLGTSSRKLLI